MAGVKLFLSVGEPSGDVHGGNLIDELRRRDPALMVTGFGGRRMIEAGAQLIHPLAEQPSAPYRSCSGCCAAQTNGLLAIGRTPWC
jgi:hypothetical protein